MRLCKDGEISSSGFKYVIIENLAGEGGQLSGSVLTWVVVPPQVFIPYAAVLYVL